MPVLPRPTSLITTYLPIFSGILRGGADRELDDLDAGADMTRAEAKNPDRILFAPSGHCDPYHSVPALGSRRDLSQDTFMMRNDHSQNARTQSRSRDSSLRYRALP